MSQPFAVSRLNAKKQPWSRLNCLIQMRDILPMSYTALQNGPANGNAPRKRNLQIYATCRRKLGREVAISLTSFEKALLSQNSP